MRRLRYRLAAWMHNTADRIEPLTAGTDSLAALRRLTAARQQAATIRLTSELRRRAHVVRDEPRKQW